MAKGLALLDSSHDDFSMEDFPIVHRNHPMMKRSLLFLAPLLLANLLHGQATPLFDGKSMSGWYVFLKDGGKNPAAQSEVSIKDSCFHFQGKSIGYLSTEKEYGDYKLTVSYRWADTTKSDVKRNSGLIYHAIGEDRMWCNGMEFQMQQDDTGDLWLIPGTEANARIKVDAKEIGGTQRGERVLKREANEKPLGEWNTLVLICKGNTFEHWVNGKKVLDGTVIDREKGRIQFQAEGHEVWIKDISIEDLASAK